MLSIVDPLLALNPGAIALVVLGATVFVVVVFIVIAPWRTIRQEPPIPEEAETRLLLGEDFAHVEDELQAHEPDSEATVSEVDGRERHE
jgi:hypothetical protein